HKKETDGCPKSFRPSKSTLDSDEYPSFDPSKLGRFKSAQLGQLAFTFFNFMFPMAVVALLVKETNDYFTFCTTTPTRNEDDKREDRHKAKEPTNGRASWPEGGITANMMYTVIGIVLTLGLVRLPEIANHWDVSDYHDFKLVRQSMTRDMFLLIYSRFFHMAPAPSPKRHPDGSYDEGWDALWHIR
ncbi:unnamed protein product, partial [Pylaiella littoralis]